MQYAVLTAFLYALTVVTAPLAYQLEASVVFVLAVRFACNVGLSTILGGGITRRGLPSQTDAILVVVASLALLGQTYGLMSAVKMLPVSIAITVFFTFPVISYLIEMIRKRARPNIYTLAVFGMAVTGVWFLSNPEAEQWNSAGMAWALIAAALQATLNVVAERVRHVRGWQMVQFTSILPMVVYGVWVFHQGVTPPLGAFGWSIVSATCFATGLFLYYRAVLNYGPVRTANILYLEPVFVILLSLGIFGDTLSLQQWLGVLMVATSTAIVEIQEFRRLRRTQLKYG